MCTKNVLCTKHVICIDCQVYVQIWKEIKMSDFLGKIPMLLNPSLSVQPTVITYRVKIEVVLCDKRYKKQTNKIKPNTFNITSMSDYLMDGFGYLTSLNLNILSLLGNSFARFERIVYVFCRQIWYFSSRQNWKLTIWAFVLHFSLLGGGVCVGGGGGGCSKTVADGRV